MSDRARLRLFVLQLLVLSLFVTLASRLWFLQILDSRKFQAKQVVTSQHTITTAAARGRILDTQGRQLATNLATYMVSVQIKDFPPASNNKKKQARRTAVVHKLAGLLQMDEKELSDRTTLCEFKNGALVKGERGRCWRGSPYQPIPLLSDATERQAFLIEEHAEDFPGVDATLEPVRSYPYGQLAAHMLGYIQPSTDQADEGTLVGRTGLELQYDASLRGTPDRRSGRPTGAASSPRSCRRPTRCPEPIWS
jgi:penicillin-binding protein 2